MKIFIAESSPGIYERLVRLLSSIEGLEIEGEITQPIEAVPDIVAASPNAVVLDGGFAGGKGLEALKKIKHENPKIIVFVMSDFPNAHYKKKCIEAGADFFFDKSNEIDWLLDTLKVLNQKSL